MSLVHSLLFGETILIRFGLGILMICITYTLQQHPLAPKLILLFIVYFCLKLETVAFVLPFYSKGIGFLWLACWFRLGKIHFTLHLPFQLNSTSPKLKCFVNSVKNYSFKWIFRIWLQGFYKGLPFILYVLSFK